MEKSYFKREIQKNVVEIRLNRPEVHNAFNDKLVSDLTREFQALNSDVNLRLVVLTGEGRSFCAGADLNWMKSMKNYSELENMADSQRLYELFATIDHCPVPVLGKINGHALGGGLGLLAVCDHCVSHDKAKFGFTEVKLGLIPAVISAFCLDKIGAGQARSWFLSGECFSAREAKEMNLIHDIVSVETFEDHFEEVLANFLTAAPEAAREAKKLLNEMKEISPARKKDYTCSTIAKLRVAREAQEGMSALLEKRKPDWIEK